MYWVVRGRPKICPRGSKPWGPGPVSACPYQDQKRVHTQTKFQKLQSETSMSEMRPKRTHIPNCFSVVWTGASATDTTAPRGPVCSSCSTRDQENPSQPAEPSCCRQNVRVDTAYVWFVRSLTRDGFSPSKPLVMEKTELACHLALVCLSDCLSVCLSVCLCLSLSLSLSLSHHHHLLFLFSMSPIFAVRLQLPVVGTW